MKELSPQDRFFSFIPENIQKYVPLLAVFISGIGFSFQTLLIKLLEEHDFRTTFQVIIARGLIQWLFAGFAVRYAVSTPKGEMKGPLLGPSTRITIIMILRAFIGFGGIGFSFLAVERLPLADAICLVMLSPLVSAILAYFVLGEPFRRPEMIATAISICGMIFIVKPTFIFSKDVALDHVGVLYGFISAFCAGSAYLFVRILGTIAKMPWENVCVVQGIGQLILSPIFLVIFNQDFIINLTPYEFFTIALTGVIGALSQILMTVGMQREKSAAAGAMRMSDVLFGFIWQQAFTHDSVSFLSILGAVLLMSSIILILVSKEKAKINTSTNINIKNSSNTSSSYEQISVVEMPMHHHPSDNNLAIGSEHDESDYAVFKKSKITV